MASQPAQPQAQAQIQTQQQPTDCLLHIILDVKCARATHDFLTHVFPVPASEGRIFLYPGDNHNNNNNDNNDNDNNNHNNHNNNHNDNENDNDNDTVFVFPYVAVRFTSSNPNSCCAPPGPGKTTGGGGGHGAVQLAVLVDNVQLVRARLALKGVRYRDVPVGADGLEWLEFLDPDGYSWRVGRLVWETLSGQGVVGS